MSPGGPARQRLESLRNDYDISAHGVGLSLGSSTGLDPKHLQGLKDLYETFSPFIVSEHLSWARHHDTHFGGLFPIALYKRIP